MTSGSWLLLGLCFRQHGRVLCGRRKTGLISSMAEPPAAHLCVINDARALAWILSEGRLAFSEHWFGALKRLMPGHRMLLYTTQQCFGGPTRAGRSRIIGEAILTSRFKLTRVPYRLAGRTFPVEGAIEIIRLAPLADSVVFVELVPRLHGFKGVWNLRLRGAPVPLDEHDCSLISAELARKAVNLDDVMGNYMSYRSISSEW